MKLKAGGVWLSQHDDSRFWLYNSSVKRLHEQKIEGFILTPGPGCLMKTWNTPMHWNLKTIHPCDRVTLYPHLPTGGTINNLQSRKSS